MPGRRAGRSRPTEPLRLRGSSFHPRRTGDRTLIVFWDLDGPILDVSERYWRVHRDVLSELGASHLEKSRYWDMKRHRVPEARIADACGASAKAEPYRVGRLDRIEQQTYLALDTLQEDAISVLDALGQGREQVLVTLRHDPVALAWQLERFDLLRHFAAVLSSGLSTDPRWRMKCDLMTGHLKDHRERAERHVLITDTETDVRSGQEMGFTTVAVANGIRDASILQAAGPDHLFDRTADLLNSETLLALF